jgi:hypothetical protein
VFRPIRINQSGFAGDGRFWLGLNSEPGLFAVEATTNFLHWEIVTNIANPTGQVLLADPAGNHSLRFYRARRLSD